MYDRKAEQKISNLASLNKEYFGSSGAMNIMLAVAGINSIKYSLVQLSRNFLKVLLKIKQRIGVDTSDC